MLAATNVLLASHGTEGALAAEQMAFRMCGKGSHLHHLIVVPGFWKGTTGDDWLNNGSTRDTFRRYLEGELGREVDEHFERVGRAAIDQELDYTNDMVVGEPDECLLNASQRQQYDLIILGSPRPKGKSGLRSRMVTNALTHKLTIPLLIVPYPDE
jgi:nucleotide-binding universal stress UspA family protein